MPPELHKVYEAVNTFGSLLYSNNIIPKKKFNITYSFIDKKHLEEQKDIKILNGLLHRLNLSLDYYLAKMADIPVKNLKDKKNIFHFSLLLFSFMRKDLKNHPRIRITQQFDLLVEKVKDVYEAIEVYTDEEAMEAINDYINGKKENFVD